VSDIEFQLSKLEIREGDLIVAKMERRLSSTQLGVVRKLFDELPLPKGARVIITDPSVDLTILTKDEINKLARDQRR
jgi:hypothetical protein